MTLYKKDSYNSPYHNCIISSYIREYDIQKANINILYKYGAISKNDYDYYYNLDRMNRQIRIGYLLKNNPDLSNVLKNGFIEHRKLFFESNNLEESDILSIKKDAIYVINKIPTILEFDNVKFINKNIYTSYYRMSNTLEFYYYLDSINNKEVLDIKGISDENIILHEAYMLDFLKYIFETAQTNSIDNIISILTNFYRKYISLELDVGYYREFNSLSKFNINSKNTISFYLDIMSDNDKQYLNISCNRILLETLYSYYTSIYFSITKNRR